jgi:hypothetical protein
MTVHACPRTKDAAAIEGGGERERGRGRGREDGKRQRGQRGGGEERDSEEEM